MVAVFLDDNKTNDVDDGKESEKRNGFILAKQQHVISYISLTLLHHCDMKLPNFTRPLYGVGEHNTKIIFLFLNLGTVLSDSNPQNFAYICQIKWN